MKIKTIVSGLVKKGIHLTFSGKIKVQKFLDEIVRRDNIKPENLINSPEIQKIVNTKNLNNSQKGKKIQDLFSGIRYPELRKCEEKFKKIKKKKIAHSPYFEGDDITIQLKKDGDYELRIRSS